MSERARAIAPQPGHHPTSPPPTSRLTLRILFCCSVSREMLSGRSSLRAGRASECARERVSAHASGAPPHPLYPPRTHLSTTPLTKLRYSGIMSSALSEMKTRRTYSLMLFCCGESEGER